MDAMSSGSASTPSIKTSRAVPCPYAAGACVYALSGDTAARRPKPVVIWPVLVAVWAELVLEHLQLRELFAERRQLNFGLVDRDTCVVGKGGSAHTVIRSMRECLRIFSSRGICENSYCHLGVRVTTALEERCIVFIAVSAAVFVSYKAMMLSLANIDETAEKWNAALVAAAKKILFVRDEDDEK